MPKIRAGNITMNYDQQGSGEPLVLIPYLAADYACYAFQVADYSKHFTCISVDLRGTGESDKPAGVYSTEMFADDVAALMQAIGVPKAHIYGLSLGAAAGIWLAAKYPDRVKSLSLHSGWPKSDAYIKTVVQGWQVMAKAMNSVPEMVIQGIFPWCFTPELYAQKPDYIQALCRLRARPAQAAGRRVHPGVRCGDRSRRRGAAWQDPRSDADHFRAPRHGDLNPLRRPTEVRHQGFRAVHLRGLLARAAVRKRGRVQRENAGVLDEARRLTVIERGCRMRNLV